MLSCRGVDVKRGGVGVNELGDSTGHQAALVIAFSTHAGTATHTSDRYCHSSNQSGRTSPQVCNPTRGGSNTYMGEHLRNTDSNPVKSHGTGIRHP